MLAYKQHILKNTADKSVIIIKEDNYVYTLLSETGNIYPVKKIKLEEQIDKGEYKVQSDLTISDFFNKYPQFESYVRDIAIREGYLVTFPVHTYFRGRPVKIETEVKKEKNNKLLLLIK